MLGLLKLRGRLDVPVTRWTLVAAIAGGLVAALWLVPHWQDRALVARAMSVDAATRTSAWQVLTVPRWASYSSRPRVMSLQGKMHTALIDGAPDPAVLDAVAHLEALGLIGWDTSPPEVMFLAIAAHARTGGDQEDAARHWAMTAPPWHVDQARATLHAALPTSSDVVTLPP